MILQIFLSFFFLGNSDIPSPSHFSLPVSDASGDLYFFFSPDLVHPPVLLVWILASQASSYGQLTWCCCCCLVLSEVLPVSFLVFFLLTPHLNSFVSHKPDLLQVSSAPVLILLTSHQPTSAEDIVHHNQPTNLIMIIDSWKLTNYIQQFQISFMFYLQTCQ